MIIILVCILLAVAALIGTYLYIKTKIDLKKIAAIVISSLLIGSGALLISFFPVGDPAINLYSTLDFGGKVGTTEAVVTLYRTLSFGGKVGVTGTGMNVYDTLSFGGKHHIPTAGNWSEWWEFTVSNMSVTNITPSNGASHISLNPSLSAQINHSGGVQMTAYFWTNASGSWAQLGGSHVGYNGTYTDNNASNMDEYTTLYYWSINVTDGVDWLNTTYSFTTTVLYQETVRTDGINYFVWLGDNTTSAWYIKSLITNLNSGTEYIAIWNQSATWSATYGLWSHYYGTDTGNNFTAYTFDVIKLYLNDGAGTATVNMTEDIAVNYNAARDITCTNTSNNKGFNYAGFSPGTSTLEDVSETNLEQSIGYWVGVWDNTAYTWHFWIAHITPSPFDKTINTYDVLEIKVGTTRYLNMA